MPILPSLSYEVAAAKTLIPMIGETRRELLESLGNWIGARVQAGKNAELVFVCTHNSRRSHLGQVWAKTMATVYGIAGVETFSAGTEATACHPNTIGALAAQGFAIEKGQGENPVYRVAFAENLDPSLCWSKVWSDDANPKSGFAAVMVCGNADKNCPIIPGCDLRLGITYVDPKAADGSLDQDAAYRTRSLQIAAEMAYVMSCAAEKREASV